MSLQSGPAEHRYITILHHPFPGYRVSVPHPDTAQPPVSKRFAGYAHSLDAYLAAAFKWRDDTYAMLHHKPLGMPASSTVPAARGTVPTLSRAERQFIRLLRVSPAHRRGLFVDAATAALTLRAAGDSREIDILNGRRLSFKDSCEKNRGTARAPRDVAARAQSSATLRELPKAVGRRHGTRSQKQDPLTEDGGSAEPCPMECIACAAKKRVLSQLAVARPRLLNETTYDPGRLIAFLVEKLALESDRALAKRIDISPASLSKIRNRKLPVGATFLIRSHEASDIPVKALRLLMGDRRKLPR